MRIYSRYLLKEMLAVFLLSLLALLSVYLLVDFFSKVDNALENHAGMLPLVMFLANQIPFVLGKFIPLALLLATMLALGGMAQHNEIVAFQAGGLSLLRLARPMVGAGLVLALLTFLINNYIVPVTSLKADHIKDVTIRGDKEDNLYNLKSLWYLSGDAVYFFEDLDPARKTIAKALIYRFAKDRRLSQRFDIEGLVYHPEDKKWIGERVRITAFRFRDGFTDVVGVDQEKNLELAINETFQDFMVPRKDPDRMSLRELRSYIGKAKNAGLSYMEYTVEIFNRMLFPFSCPLMVLLAIPFSLAARRHGGAARGVAISLGLGFSFWVTLSLSLALGQGKILGPLPAAILPYILYTGLALFMFRQKIG
ncbi:MAG: LPS export ABC transporter permease LptG [Deltaproteobacteria bacterium]|nr:LPS export ABC transporter permease LptG [Deltaproteobacteria bacterium]